MVQQQLAPPAYRPTTHLNNTSAWVPPRQVLLPLWYAGCKCPLHPGSTVFQLMHICAACLIGHKACTSFVRMSQRSCCCQPACLLYVMLTSAFICSCRCKDKLSPQGPSFPRGVQDFPAGSKLSPQDPSFLRRVQALPAGPKLSPQGPSSPCRIQALPAGSKRSSQGPSSPRKVQAGALYRPCSTHH